MEQIKLTQGQFALVDDEDFDYLNQWKWHVLKCKYSYYVIRSEQRNNKVTYILMHRIITNAIKEKEVDHIDLNGLNNQKINLRVCSRQENRWNRRPYGKYKYTGVHSTTNKYGSKYIVASIRKNGKSIYLGIFKTEEEAARAYDKKAKEFYGEFANLNFK
jgi:hypothetical protein